MKKVFALFLLLLHLVSSTQLTEVAKIPVLFEHFSEHQSINPQITFFEFVIDHYNNTPHTDNDEERDNQLPFKTINQSTPHFVAITPNKSQSISKIAYTLAKSHNGLYIDPFIPSSFTEKVWQPPKQMMSI